MQQFCQLGGENFDAQYLETEFRWNLINLNILSVGCISTDAVQGPSQERLIVLFLKAAESKGPTYITTAQTPVDMVLLLLQEQHSYTTSL